MRIYIVLKGVAFSVNNNEPKLILSIPLRKVMFFIFFSSLYTTHWPGLALTRIPFYKASERYSIFCLATSLFRGAPQYLAQIQYACIISCAGIGAPLRWRNLPI